MFRFSEEPQKGLLTAPGTGVSGMGGDEMIRGRVQVLTLLLLLPMLLLFGSGVWLYDARPWRAETMICDALGP